VCAWKGVAVCPIESNLHSAVGVSERERERERSREREKERERARERLER